jgi:microsomal dipeptidase-like Zn-dependent dipeptidase
VDIPRLVEGGFELAVFSAPTRYHLASNYERTPPLGDVMALAAIASRWPRDAWLDPFARALVLAAKLRAAEYASPERLRVIRTRADLHSLISAQSSGDTLLGAVLLIEGMQAIAGRLESIDSLFAAGYRVFGIAHMFDNEVGGSAHGWHKGGLTPFGRRAVARIDSVGGIIDLAHASRATIDDVLALTARPVVVSHTGITSACPGTRNLPDEVVSRIASRGGLVAVGFWDAAVCGTDAPAIARSIRRAIDVAGIDHVALGSDFDGAVRVPFDAAHMPALTAALVTEGLTRAEIRAVMGENQKRFLLEALPAR